MTDLISAVLGISFAAGLNAYATVLMLGILQRLGVVQLPSSLTIVATIPVMAAAAFLFAIEFVADKIPVVDSVWDAIHTLIRPLAGGLLAYGMVGNVDPQWQVIAALAGGSIALTSHTAKASTRAAANVSPEPFSNWVLSVSEDILSFSLVWLATAHPWITVAIVLVLLAAAVYIIRKLSRFARRLFSRAA
jgi:hypothetical protein